MVDFHSREKESKVLNRFTEWIHKSTQDLYIPSLTYKIKVRSKLDFFLSFIYDPNWLNYLNYFWFQSFKFCAANQILSSVKSQWNLKKECVNTDWSINVKMQKNKTKQKTNEKQKKHKKKQNKQKRKKKRKKRNNSFFSLFLQNNLH